MDSYTAHKRAEKLEKLPFLCYGGDYNPEQWTEDVWLEDMELMKEAGVNFISLGIFSWAMIQSDENVYDFSWMDKIMDLLHKNGISVDLATATASVPPWVYQRYEDVYPVDAEGSRIWYGSRQSYCPNSPNYRHLAGNLAAAIAERYKDHPALAMWHVNNEYSCHVHACYCDTCAKAFRKWLQRRYTSLQELNSHWGTTFWSQRYHDWEEIIPPRKTPTLRNPSHVLDYQRFMSDSILDCYLHEKDILKRFTPQIPITTNFMGHWKPLDLHKWAKSIDMISWDAYPDPSTDNSRLSNALDHDLMRSLKGGSPFLLMEQAPSQVNWRHVNSPKRPGQNRLYSYQAISRGADGIMYFQWRQSLRGAEKFHSACINHGADAKSPALTLSRSRVYEEVARIGTEMKQLKRISGARTPAQVGIVYDYEAWWAAEYEPRPNGNIGYRDMISDYYRYFFSHNIPVQFVSQEASLEGFDLVIAPYLYMLKESFTPKIEHFVREGGIFLCTFFSAYADESDGIFPEGYPGPLKNILGLEVEEIVPLQKDEFVDLVFHELSVSDKRNASDQENPGKLKIEGRGQDWCEHVHPLNENVQVLGEFASDFVSGRPAVTKCNIGKGSSYYVATRPGKAILDALLTGVCSSCGIYPLLETPEGVEVTIRSRDSKSWLFIINTANKEQHIKNTHYAGKDLLSGENLALHDDLLLFPKDVKVVELN